MERELTWNSTEAALKLLDYCTETAPRLLVCSEVFAMKHFEFNQVSIPSVNKKNTIWYIKADVKFTTDQSQIWKGNGAQPLSHFNSTNVVSVLDCIFHWNLIFS